MNDIVKRIRQQSYFGLEPYEAADEIEQLRQRVQELEKERDAAWKEAVEHVEAQQNIINELTAERNELRARLLQKMDDCVKAEKQNEQLRQRVAELENERDKLLESLDTAVKAIIIFRNEPALERLHSLRSSNGYGVLQQAMDIGLDVITRVKGGAA